MRQTCPSRGPIDIKGLETLPRSGRGADHTPHDRLLSNQNGSKTRPGHRSIEHRAVK
jgi:hypothetical protein